MMQMDQTADTATLMQGTGAPAFKIEKDGQYSLEYGSEMIRFRLQRDVGKTLRISVTPEGAVLVTAPAAAKENDILGRVNRRAAWISSQLDHFKRYQPGTPARQYVSGETHYYLGRQYRLKVAQGERNGVKLSGRYFQVTTHAPPEPSGVKALLDAWYLDHAKTLFLRRMAVCLKPFKAYGIEQPRIIVRAMKSRWGSCSRSGTVTLNRHLAKAPIHCVDYVITHELCHLKYYGHTKEFYALISVGMPDWRERKERLSRVILE